jgi:xanthine/uracil permease
VALTLGAGNLTLNIGSFALSGIGTASFGAIILYQLLRERASEEEAVAAADSAVDPADQIGPAPRLEA